LAGIFFDTISTDFSIENIIQTITQKSKEYCVLKRISKLFSSKVDISAHALVIDVRSPGEFAHAHIKGAKNIPVDSLQSSMNTLAAYKDREVVVYCRSGQRANMAEIVLRQSNFTHIINVGSMEKIRNANIVSA
jgi:rhodanese-related sulfurtransferase